MKEYAKPDFFVTEFALNKAVAACDPTLTYNEVTVDCVITSSHKIFYDGCSDNYNDCAIVTYNSQEYLVWSNGGTVTAGRYDAGTGSPLTGQKLLDKLVKAMNPNYSWNQFHAGPINPDITSVVNSSL